MSLWKSCAALAAGVVGLPAGATTVTSVPGGIDVKIVQFAPYDGVTAPTTITGSVDVGSSETGEAVNLSFSPDGASRMLGAAPIDLGSNGIWPARGGYVGLNAPSGEMTFRFTRGMNFVGGFFNLDPDSFDGDLTVTAYNADDDVLEDLAIGFRLGQPGVAGLGEFHGFLRSSADIWRITVSNKQAVLDDLSFGTLAGVVPAPRPVELLGAALLAATLLGMARRRATVPMRRSRRP